MGEAFEELYPETAPVPPDPQRSGITARRVLMPPDNTSTNAQRRQREIDNIIDSNDWSSLTNYKNQDVLNAVWKNSKRRENAVKRGLNLFILLATRNEHFNPDMHKPLSRPAKKLLTERILKSRNWETLYQVQNQDIINAIWNNPILKAQVEKRGIDLQTLLNNRKKTFDATMHPKFVASVPRKAKEKLPFTITKPEEMAFIGDSNAIRLSWRIHGKVPAIGAGGVSSSEVLATLEKNKEILRGVKVAFVRLGGNDGEKAPNETMTNQERIVQICEEMGVQEVCVLTRPPYDPAYSSQMIISANAARRACTLEEFDRIDTAAKGSKTRVRVIDWYDQMRDGQGNLKREYVNPNDPDKLHMTEQGYRSSLLAFAQNLGIKNIDRWIQ